MAIEEEEGGGGSQCFKGYAMLRNDVRGERICNDVELLSIDVFFNSSPIWNDSYKPWKDNSALNA